LYVFNATISTEGVGIALDNKTYDRLFID